MGPLSSHSVIGCELGLLPAVTYTHVTPRGLATYASSVSSGHPEHWFRTVSTPKGLSQDLLMMTILEDSACSVTPTTQTKQLLA